MCRKGAGEANQQDARNYYYDQINRPGMHASTDQVEMPGAAFVPVCVNAHGSSPPRKHG